MRYIIKEVHILYNGEQIAEIAVLWADGDSVRATYCTSMPCSGYKFIKTGETFSSRLLQEVAAAGMYLPDYLKKKYFPCKHKWSR